MNRGIFPGPINFDAKSSWKAIIFDIPSVRPSVRPSFYAHALHTTSQTMKQRLPLFFCRDFLIYGTLRVPATILPCNFQGEGIWAPPSSQEEC